MYVERLDKVTVKRVFGAGAFLSVSTLIIVMNNFIDQYLVALGDASGVKAYTLDVPIYWILIATGTVAATACASIVKRYLDSGDREAAEEAAIRAVVYSVLFATVISLIVSAVIIPIFESIAESQVRKDAITYLTPLLIFNFATTAAIVLAALLKAEGKPGIYLFTLLMMFFGNVVSDRIYVGILDMGVFGNGLGTATGSIIAMLFAIACFRMKDSGISISFRNFKWSREDAVLSFMVIRIPLTRVIIKSVVEICIRFSLFMTFSLSYGIPMLYSSIISAIGVGLSAALATEYRRLYSEKDFTGIRNLFIGSSIIGFLLMSVLSMTFFTFAGPLASVFTDNASLSENHSVLVWTLRVLCFTAPFVGLTNMFTSVTAVFGRMGSSMAILIIWQILRLVAVVWAINTDFQLAIYFILAERMIAAAVEFGVSAWRIRDMAGSPRLPPDRSFRYHR